MSAPKCDKLFRRNPSRHQHKPRSRAHTYIPSSHKNGTARHTPIHGSGHTLQPHPTETDGHEKSETTGDLWTIWGGEGDDHKPIHGTITVCQALWVFCKSHHPTTQTRGGEWCALSLYECGGDGKDD